jgi:site-specific DNA-methyltransferase (adenine-specific)
MTAYMPASKTDNWATPKWLFDEYNQKHEFGLDAAASSTNHLCDNWFGLDHVDPAKRDGLTADWTGYGAVWCNPPYGRVIKDWVEKALSHNEITVVMLLPSRTDTQWFHQLSNHVQVNIKFMKGRLKFGDSKTAAPFPSIVVTKWGQWF